MLSEENPFEVVSILYNFAYVTLLNKSENFVNRKQILAAGVRDGMSRAVVGTSYERTI